MNTRFIKKWRQTDGRISEERYRRETHEGKRREGNEYGKDRKARGRQLDFTQKKSRKETHEGLKREEKGSEKEEQELARE